MKNIDLKARYALRALDQGGCIILGHSPVLYDRNECTLEGIEPKLFISLRQRGYIEAGPFPAFNGSRKYYITAAGRQALKSGEM